MEIDSTIPQGSVDHIYFNASSNAYVDSTAEIYFYHNSIAGGRNALLMAGFNWGLWHAENVYRE